jgi:hypothetical protein
MVMYKNRCGIMRATDEYQRALAAIEQRAQQCPLARIEASPAGIIAVDCCFCSCLQDALPAVAATLAAVAVLFFNPCCRPPSWTNWRLRHCCTLLLLLLLLRLLTPHQPPSSALRASPSTPTGCAGSQSPHAARCPAPERQQGRHMHTC